MNFQIYKLDLEKAEEPEIKLPTSTGSQRKQGNFKKTSVSEFPTVYCDPHSQGFGVVNKAEVDVSLELSYFFNDPTDVGNLISVPLPFLNPA